MLKTLNTLALFLLTVLTFAQVSSPILQLNTDMHTGNIKRISIDASGKYVLSVSHDKTAKLWDATTGNLLKIFRIPIGLTYEGTLEAGALSPDGKIAAVSGCTGYEWDKKISIYLFNTNNGEIFQRLSGLGDFVRDLEFSPDGTYLAAALATTGVVIYRKVNSTNFEKHIQLPHPNDCYNIAFENSCTLIGENSRSCGQGY